jgi:hypothetical protein
VFYHLLPYIEEQVLYNQGGTSSGGHSVGVKGVARQTVKVFVCPEDTSAPPGYVYADVLATCSYAANFQAFGFQGARYPASFTDGTSNTILYTERHQVCDDTPCAWGYDGVYYWSPMFAYYGKDRPQTTPAPGQCDPERPQSPHSGGIQVALADASVRLVSPAISQQTWWAACTPNGGEVLGSDW